MSVKVGPMPNTLYVGLSTDAKPGPDVEHAAMFYEHDTGVTFIWTGSINKQGAGWVEYIPQFPIAFKSVANVV